MGRCGFCRRTILFGGVHDAGRRYCNEQCRQAGRVLQICDALPEDTLDEHVLDVHSGDCPRCGGPGPIDVHTAYRVWSVILVTVSQSDPRVCCRSCGIKGQLGGALFSLLAGWWGFPAGLIFTPVFVIRNIVGIVRCPDPNLPSEALERLVRMRIGATLIDSPDAADPPGASLHF